MSVHFFVFLILEGPVFHSIYHDFLHVYRPLAVAKKTQRPTFWYQQELSVTFDIYCEFQTNQIKNEGARLVTRSHMAFFLYQQKVTQTWMVYMTCFKTCLNIYNFVMMVRQMMELWWSPTFSHEQRDCCDIKMISTGLFLNFYEM